MKKISRILFVAIFLAAANVGISQTISDYFYVQMTHIFQYVDTAPLDLFILFR